MQVEGTSAIEVAAGDGANPPSSIREEGSMNPFLAREKPAGAGAVEKGKHSLLPAALFFVNCSHISYSCGGVNGADADV